MTIAQQIGRSAASMEVSQRAKDFCTLARIIALSKGELLQAQRVLREPRNKILLGNTARSVIESAHGVWTFDIDIRQKAAVAAGSTADSGWALPLADYDLLAAAFLESLRNFAIFDRMLPQMRRVPLRTRVGASSSGASGTTVPQGSVKPISRLTLSSVTIDEQKAVATLVVTNELARFGSIAADNLFSVELSNAVAVATDEQFVTVLTAGATSNGSSGVTAEHVRNDLRGMLTQVTTSARSALFLLMTSTIAKVLSVLHASSGSAAFPGMTPNGGTIGGLTAVVSDGVPSQTMILVDAHQVAAASETVQLSAVTQAVVQLDTGPDSPVSGSTVLTSLWQNNLTGLRAERVFGCQKLTSSGVCVLTGANYTGDSPGP